MLHITQNYLKMQKPHMRSQDRFMEVILMQIQK